MKEIYELSAYATKAADFFKTLLEHKTDLVLDVRLKNVSQLCGFTKKRDLEYLISQITQARYIHDLNFAPTQELLDGYIITHQIDWKEYASAYQSLIEERNGIVQFITTYSSYSHICILGTATRKRQSHSAILVSLLKNTLK